MKRNGNLEHPVSTGGYTKEKPLSGQKALEPKAHLVQRWLQSDGCGASENPVGPFLVHCPGIQIFSTNRNTS